MIPQSEFNKALKVATCFIDPSLPGLHVVHFNFLNPDSFEMVATDGHRLVTIELSAPHSCPPGSKVSVPLAMAEDLLRMFPDTEDTEITLAFWDSKLLITNGVKTHTVQGPPPADYPDYPSITGAVDPTIERVSLNPKLLVDILKDCSPLSVNKKPDGPRVDLIPFGAERPLRIEFVVHPDIETVSAVTAYLMPLKVSGRIT